MIGDSVDEGGAMCRDCAVISGRVAGEQSPHPDSGIS